MPKVISNTIEDEVTFLTDTDVEYVSLVGHGANRTPFRILKNDKGGLKMEKVVTAVLIPKKASEEDVTAFLEGYRQDSIKEYDTYKSYIQVDADAVNPDTVEIIHINKDSGVLGVVGALIEKEEPVEKEETEETVPKADAETVAEAKAEEDQVTAFDLVPINKEAVDWATLDDVYMELYAMADIVSGSLRQSSMEEGSRKTTVLTAISNFYSFAEAILENTDASKSVDPEKHPALKHHLKEEKEEPVIDKSEKEDLVVEKSEKKEPEKKEESVIPTEKLDEVFEKVMAEVRKLLEEKASTDDLATKAEEITTAKSSVDEVQTNLKDVTEKLELLKDIPTVVAELSKTVEKLENSTRTSKADADDTLDTSHVKKTSTFQGAIFNKAR